MVPFENSTNGSVVFTLDQLADREGRYADLSVCAETYLDVHHCLLGRIPSTSSSTATPAPQGDAKVKQPLASLAHIRRVYSHPQAWGQVAGFMHAHLKGIETVDTSSTSRAAELAAADPTDTSAAISSAMAGEAVGLQLLGRNIEDRDDNTTRFLVLRKGKDAEGALVVDQARPRPGGEGAAATAATGSGGAGQREPRTKSLLSFTVPHTAPGALADVLDCFRRCGLNLTSINSRPRLVGDAPFQYVFFVEFEGHRFDDPEGRFARVLESVADVAQESRWLGSFVNMKKKKTTSAA